MTSLNVTNVNQNMVQGLIDQFQVDGIQASGEVNSADKTLTLKLTNQSGDTRTLQLQLPDLDKPQCAGEKAAQQLELVSDKIDALVSELKSAAKGVTVSMTSTTAIFDIYALIATLQKVAQQQRETAATVRRQAHESVQASLNQSAQSIREAGAISGSSAFAMAVCATVSAGVSTVMTGVSIGATCRANSAAGLSDAKADYTTAKNDLASAQKVADGQGLTPQQTTDIRAALADKPELQAKFDSIKPTGENGTGPSPMDTKVANAEQAVAAKETIVSEKTGKLTTATNAVEAAEPENKDAAITVRDQASAELTTAKADLAQSKGDVQSAKMERSDAIMDVKKGLDEKINSLPEGPERTQLEGLRDSFMGANKEAVVDGLKTKLDVAKGDYAAACKLSTENEAGKRANIYRSCGDVCSQIGKAFDSFMAKDKAAAETNQQARAKELEAQTESARAQLDSVKELEDSARQMQDAVLEMRKSIEQMDAQLAQTIMRA